MAIVWNLIDTGGVLQYPAMSILDTALAGGTISNAFSGGFMIKKDDSIVLFHGSFTGDGGGGIGGGTITGFDIYFGDFDHKIAEVTGYSLAYSAFETAADGLKNGGNPLPFLEAFLSQGMTVNGASQADLGFENEQIYGSRGADLIFGNGGSDAILDLGGDDLIYGGAGNDIISELPLFGVAGNDTVYGGDGDDNIDGGGADDFISGGSGVDTIDGGAGTDTADFSEKAETVDVTLDGPNEVDVLIGGFAEDRIRNVENINGGTAKDSVTGDGLINRLVGNAGKDLLDGGAGSDTLVGGLGKDKLTGGEGDDTFVFDVKATGRNADKIKDFKPADDTIALDDAVFKKLDLGALKAKFFHIGEAAADGNDHIVYDAATGALHYDRNGAESGGEKLIARLDAHLNLTANDFLVI